MTNKNEITINNNELIDIEKPIWSTVSTELSWVHYQELIRIYRKEERELYELANDTEVGDNNE